jgi:tryptophanyl-tRNA synthetase
MQTILSGIKPTGEHVHLGNYFGAMKQYVDLQQRDNCERFYFIANYHALTTMRSRADLEQNSWNILREYLAAGIDTDKSNIFIQSDIPEHTELAWILNCLTPLGLLERAHAYKDAIAKGKEANVGLFDYPVLMAADILMYQSHYVPVGKDQKQHIEIARDLAEKFNHYYGETFVLPEPLILADVESVPGIDGEKMSKSYNNTITPFTDAKTMEKRIMSIKTDSLGIDDPKDVDSSIIIQLLRLVADQDTINHVEAKFRSGGMGYGEAKKILSSKVQDYFAPMQKRYAEITDEELKVAVKKGAEKARSVAQKTIAMVRQRTGLISSYKYV